MTMRSSTEVKQYAESTLGMKVNVRSRGESYRAGGDILAYPEGLDWMHTPVSIKHSQNAAFDPTGYDGRGRYYDLWIFNAPKEGEKQWEHTGIGAFYNAPEDKRMVIGEPDTKSGSPAIYFIEKGSDNFNDLAELFEGWKN